MPGRNRPLSNQQGGDTIKTIKIDLPKNLERIEIFPLADLHLGDENCDYNHFVTLVDYIRETPNAYCILGGDMMDTAVRQSIGDSYTATMSPMEQLQQCVSLFGEIKDKILCILPGNHEQRVYRQDGIDTTQMMAVQLGLAD